MDVFGHCSTHRITESQPHRKINRIAKFNLADARSSCQTGDGGLALRDRLPVVAAQPAAAAMLPRPESRPVTTFVVKLESVPETELIFCQLQ